MKDLELPSGSKVGFQMATFEEGLALYREWQRAMLPVSVQGDDELNLNFIKNTIFSLGVSERLEAALFKCMRRCTYNGEAIKLPTTFEEERAREDFTDVCAAVLKENLAPFTKPLLAQFRELFRAIVGIRGLTTARGGNPNSTTSSSTSSSSGQATEASPRSAP